MDDKNMIVYTANLGDKDDLLPLDKEEGVQYICFSDIPFTHDTWEFRYAYPYGQTDPRRVARMYKLLSHVWFPGQQTIWIDARGGFKMPVKEMFEKYSSNTIAVRKHPTRTCIYDEASVIIQQNYEDSRIVDTQMRKYASVGFPGNYGLHETGCLVRDNSKPLVRTFNALWHAEVAMGSKRDQLAFDFVRWYHGIHIVEIDREDVYFLKHRIKTDKET